MRGRWVLAWALCGSLVLVLVILRFTKGDDVTAAANSIAATVISLLGVLSAWVWRRSARQERSTTDQLTEAQKMLARLVERQWRHEAGLRQLHHPVPLPVSWSDSSQAGVCDHVELVGGTISCRADQVEELAEAFRRLPRRRLVVLGSAGSGKSTFAVLLSLALLRTPQDDEPVPVLLTAASWDPARESIHDWLRRRIAADYPALADTDTYGPSAIDDLLAGHRVLPVIDGLDELPEHIHADVLTALRETLDTDAPLVLTCRTAQYTAAAVSAGVLRGAAVVEPSGLSARESLALLRLATAPGPAQRRWDPLADHLNDNPQGVVAEAFASPLTVALARTVYAEGTGDPGELRDFATREAIEDHLLDTLVPSVYAAAGRRAPAGRSCDPDDAHRYLTQIACSMQREGTYDLAWWQLYRWVPTVARTWARCAAWTVTLFVLTLLGYATGRAFPGYSPEKLAGLEWYPGSLAVALACMCMLAAWIAARPGFDTRRLISTVLTAVCGALAFAIPGLVYREDPPLAEAYAIACVLFWGFAFFLVLFPAGPPAPPSAPSRGTLTPRDWPRRLILALVVFLGTTALAAAAFRLYALVLAPSDDAAGRHAHPVELPWTDGLILGAFFGALQVVLCWTRGTTGREEVIDPVSTVCADRLVTLVGCGVGSLLVTLPYNLSFVLVSEPPASWQPDDTLFTALLCALLKVGPTGLVLALAAHAWPHYTAARLLLAARGRLPWRLQAFLGDAHRLGILRQVGPVYQFRHARLQQRLADTLQVPGPRISSSDPHRQPGPASLP
ncbi:NACHT domain-containing protein [Streptomyces sp. NPDC005820]|uniref:NACHT domain-containing protein n=1 Tax=Streptomyces sp. NPDC005820 TaxID=3157069 RepID=UPI0033E420AA